MSQLEFGSKTIIAHNGMNVRQDTHTHTHISTKVVPILHLTKPLSRTCANYRTQANLKKSFSSTKDVHLVIDLIDNVHWSSVEFNLHSI